MARLIESVSLVRALRRELAAHLNFLELIGRVFVDGENWCPAGSAQPVQLARVLDELADARRRLELNPAAGWQRLAALRRTLTLPVAGTCEAEPQR